MHDAILPIVRHLNDVLTSSLMDHIEGRDVLLDLTGGHDTRVNLSILLRHDVPFTAATFDFSKGDMDIASAIRSRYKFPHIREHRGGIEQHEHKYDVRVSGDGYSEVMCALHKLHYSFSRLRAHIYKHQNTDFHFSPACQQIVIDIVQEIPLCYLAGGIIQKELIRMNMPELLDFPFTWYDARHWILNNLYPKVADFIFLSYFRGRGRNFYDSKRQKDADLLLPDIRIGSGGR